MVNISLFYILTLIPHPRQNWYAQSISNLPSWWNSTSESLLLTQLVRKHLHGGRGERMKNCKQAPRLEVFCRFNMLAVWLWGSRLSERAVGPLNHPAETAQGGFSHVKQLYYQQTFSTSVVTSLSTSFIFSSTDPCKTSLATTHEQRTDHLQLPSLSCLFDTCPCCNLS